MNDNNNSSSLVGHEEKVAKKDFFEFAIKRAENEHDELIDTWKILDAKSQATTAIAGVFVAASFVFIKNSQLQLDWFEKTYLSLTIISLVVSIFFAVLAMRTKQIPMPTSGLDALNEIEGVFSTRPSDDELCERFGRFLEGGVRNLSEVNVEIRRQLKQKDMQLFLSHYGLLVAIFFICILTVGTLYR
jgi:hypothetical protein